MNDSPDPSHQHQPARDDAAPLAGASGLSGLLDLANAVMAVAIGISAIVMAVLGQTALAIGLGVVALAMALRLWRARRRR